MMATWLLLNVLVCYKISIHFCIVTFCDSSSIFIHLQTENNGYETVFHLAYRDGIYYSILNYIPCIVMNILPDSCYNTVLITLFFEILHQFQLCQLFWYLIKLLLTVRMVGRLFNYVREKTAACYVKKQQLWLWAKPFAKLFWLKFAYIQCMLCVFFLTILQPTGQLINSIFDFIHVVCSLIVMCIT